MNRRELLGTAAGVAAATLAMPHVVRGAAP